MRIFVTGASGFVGTAFCRAAVAAGHEVLGLSRRSDAVLPDGCRRICGSLETLPWGVVEDFQPDTLLHLAWIVRPRESMHSPENERLAFQSEALFRRGIQAGVRHLAGSGSCIEYAPSSLPLSEETSPLGPMERYSLAKVAVSESLRSVAEEAGISWSWFRIFYCYGESEHPDRLCPSVFRALLSGRDVVLQNPACVRDYLHVDDVAAALLASLEHPLAGPANIGSGTGVSIRELACEMARVAGKDFSHVVDASPLAQDPRPVIVADTTRLRGIGWRPSITLRDGLERVHRALCTSARR